MLIFHKNRYVGIILLQCQSPIPFNQNWRNMIDQQNRWCLLEKKFKRCYLHYITFYITSHPRVSIITLSCGGCKSRTLLDNTLQLCLHRLRSSFHICMNVPPNDNLQSVIRPPTSDHQSNFFSFELISLFIMTSWPTKNLYRDIVFVALGLGPRPFLDFSKLKNYLSTI